MCVRLCYTAKTIGKRREKKQIRMKNMIYIVIFCDRKTRKNMYFVLDCCCCSVLGNIALCILFSKFWLYWCRWWKTREAKGKESGKSFLSCPDITIFGEMKNAKNTKHQLHSAHTQARMHARIPGTSTYNNNVRTRGERTILKIKSNKRNKFVVRETANVLRMCVCARVCIIWFSTGRLKKLCAFSTCSLSLARSSAVSLLLPSMLLSLKSYTNAMKLSFISS